nr:MAG TPA: hypothetical protein [Caudoviricetes sp.]
MLVSFLDFIVKNCYNFKKVFSYLMYKPLYIEFLQKDAQKTSFFIA